MVRKQSFCPVLLMLDCEILQLCLVMRDGRWNWWWMSLVVNGSIASWEDCQKSHFSPSFSANSDTWLRCYIGSTILIVIQSFSDFLMPPKITHAATSTRWALYNRSRHTEYFFLSRTRTVLVEYDSLWGEKCKECRQGLGRFLQYLGILRTEIWENLHVTTRWSKFVF